MKSIGINDLNWESKKQETLNILAYSDVFQYPLTKKEIYERGKIESFELELCLISLVNEKSIYLIDGFYSLYNDYKFIEKRRDRNKRAKKYIKFARFITKIIVHFPFIRGVFLSGSISKNCMDKSSDIDFFIVTEPNRLWITNLFCSVFRRTLLLNRSKYFCFNYLIDSEHLAIDECTIYTAIEIKTLIPLFGYGYYKSMLKANKWVDDFFPKSPSSAENDVSKKQSSIQKLLEYFFNNNLGERLDKWLLNYSIKKRRKKLSQKLFDNPNYYTNLQRHIAKSHINDNYPNIMNEYFQRIEQRTYSKINA
jgi:hypothetical protein